MSQKRVLSTILAFFSGFLGAMAVTAILGFALAAALTAAAPQWMTKWTMAGTVEKVLWVGLPTVVLFGGTVWLLWSRHRAVAVGVLVYAVTDTTVTIWGR
jgi:intracellular septation protein A